MTVNGSNFADIKNKYCFSPQIFDGSVQLVQKYTDDKIKTDGGVVVVVRWLSYYLSVVAPRQGKYHVIFDENGQNHTCLVTWVGTTITISERNDCYIDSVSLLEKIL